MKRITVVKQTILIGLLVGLLTPVIGQDMYLPATTKSKEAKALYVEAANALYDVEFPKAFELTAKALEADPDFFMGHFFNTFNGDKALREASMDKMVAYSGKLNKGEKVIKEIAVKRKENPKYKAVEDWRKVADLYPKNIFPKAILVNQLSGSEETLDEALALLDECLALNPELPFVYNSKGYIYLAKKDYGNAENAFEQYIKVASDKANPYDSKGDYLMAVKNYKEAADMYKKAFDMNSAFIVSKKKHKEAKWMAKRVVIAKEVETRMDALVDTYNSRDMGKYTKFYLNSPEFCFVMNGEVMDSYSEFVKNTYKSKEKYSEWNVEMLKQNTEIPAENIATITQIFTYKATPVEGDKIDDKGSYTTVWRKDDGKWKVVHVIEVFPLIE